MTLQECYIEFSLDKQMNGLSKESLLDYYYCILPFLRYMGETFDISNLTYIAIRDYILSMQEKTLSKATIATYVRNLRIFLAWIDNNIEKLSFNIHKIKIPKTPKKKVHMYTDDEIIKIFQSVNSGTEWITARNRAVIALMLDSGLRQNETCTLLLCDIDFKNRTMKVTGKGDKQRTVPMGKISESLIRHYMSLCPYKIADNLFLSTSGENMTRNAVKLFVSRLSQQLPFEFSSHRLRHNFATNYCINQLEHYGRVDIYSLMIIMGHEDIKTTQRYEHFAHEIIACRDSYSHLDNILKSCDLFKFQ